MMAAGTVYHHEPLAGPARRRSRRCASTTCAPSPTSTSRTCSARSRASCTRTGCAPRRDQLRAAVRADPARARGRRHRDRVARVRLADRRVPADGRARPPLRQAVLVRDGCDHAQPHARPPLLRPDHRHAARRRHHQDRAARLGEHRRRRGRDRVAGPRGHVEHVLGAVRHPAARHPSSIRCGTTRSAATRRCCDRAGRASMSASCAPITSPTTLSGFAFVDAEGEPHPGRGRVRHTVDARPRRTTGGRTSACRMPAGPTSSSTARC